MWNVNDYKTARMCVYDVRLNAVERDAVRASVDGAGAGRVSDYSIHFIQPVTDMRPARARVLSTAHNLFSV